MHKLFPQCILRICICKSQLSLCGEALINSDLHLHLHLHLFVLKKQDIHYSMTDDSKTGHTRHVSALTVAHT